MATISIATVRTLLSSGLVRLFAVELVVAVAIFAGFAWWMFDRLDHESQRRDEHIVTREIDRIARQGNETAVRAELDRLRAGDHRVTPDIVYVFISDLNGCRRRGVGPVLACADLALWVDERTGAEQIDIAGEIHASPNNKEAQNLPTNGHYLQRAFDWWTPNAYYQGRKIGSRALLLVGIDRHVRNAERRRLLVWTVLVFAAFVLLSIGIAAGFTLRSLRRIQSFNATLDRVSQGATAERVALQGGGDELARLGAHLNAMLDQIHEQIMSLRRFTDQVAHEMRTPLTRVRSRLENTREAAGIGETRAQIDACLRDFDETITVFNSVLELARVESSTRSEMAVVDLAPLVNDVAEIYLPAAEENGQQLKVQAAPVSVFGRSELLQRLVANLVDNAVKYAGPGAVIVIACGVDGRRGFLEVSDNGRGLNAAEWPHVLKLGSRGSTSGQAAGTGLGLFLVRRIATLHRMALRFEDARPGVRARLEFAPAAAQKPWS